MEREKKIIKEIPLESFIAYLMIKENSFVLRDSFIKEEIQKANINLKGTDFKINSNLEKLLNANYPFEKRKELIISLIDFDLLESYCKKNINTKIISKII